MANQSNSKKCCPFWDKYGKRTCRLVESGLFIPTRDHILHFCENELFFKCYHYAGKKSPEQEVFSGMEGKRLENRRLFTRIPTYQKLRISRYSMARDEEEDVIDEPEADDTHHETEGRRSDGRSMVLPDWDGVESSLEMAPKGLDINRAPAEKLTMLPGVGEVRAQFLVEYRKANGPFRSIYDLGEVPGVGPVLFRKMTGLSLTARGDRHALLRELLDLDACSGSLVQRITAAMTDLLGATGSVITNREGISLASTGTMKETGARYAALGARFFFRTQRHLQRFVEKDSDCLIVPGSRPPLLLLSADDVVLIFALKSSHVSGRRLQTARRAVAEIGWLLGSRAVVTRS